MEEGSSLQRDGRKVGAGSGRQTGSYPNETSGDDLYQAEMRTKIVQTVTATWGEGHSYAGAQAQE